MWVYQNNPFSARPNGFYQNGTHQIVMRSGNYNPIAGNIAFGTTLQNMAMSHWSGVQNMANPIVTDI